MSPSLRDWAELVRLPAVVTVPGDSLVGLASAGGARSPRAVCLPLASVSMYWAGMALNDWADRELDAVERPERPLPSGRIRPGQALGAAAALTVASVGLAAVASGRRGAGAATALAAAVWAYDLVGKPSRLAPASMALTRGLDVALGATGGRGRPSSDRAGARAGSGAGTLLSVLATGLHTLAVTDLSRGEVHGADAAGAARARTVTVLGAAAVAPLLAGRLAAPVSAASVATAALGTAALATHLGPLLAVQATAGRTGDAGDARRATITGIKAFLPLQAALLAASGRPLQALALGALGTGAGRALRGGSPT